MADTGATAPLEGARQRVAQFTASPRFVGAITVLILINAATLGLETDAGIVAAYGPLLTWTDKLILIVFTMELSLKFYAHRLGFFRSGWNIFDLVIVAVAWMPASGAFSILRALRILRILRLLSVVPQLNRVINAIGHSIPGMISVIGVLSLVFYVSAVLSTKLFGQHPDPDMREWFGTVGASAYTLFQIMTLESWSMGIVRPTMDYYPWAWVFFVPFIIVTSFAVLNLFIGIIVDAMQTSQAEQHMQDRSEPPDLTRQEMKDLHDRFDQLQGEIGDLKRYLDDKGSSRAESVEP
ncbi:MAG: ion transporter [Rhodospirillaceae bacterium]|jgi:voltage-gated sodium channel|nr:ion transporter [Rhodospirillaceae bacterium]MBT4490403.1 ion transporter [Rhodospirillaceae bacterium]MBT5192314.1 ion transporter [Rhodospirillaceae bacterium]MBT5897134.1 ion transporter [Rhodospirillaceae bacterium]MBT6429564.1 ion transporter [Rhodospirillaceae bacterium]